MTKTMEEWKKEADEKRNEERKRLLAISDHDAEKLPVPDRYQRMRYQREIEAAEWLEQIRKTIPAQAEQEPTPYKERKYSKKKIVNWRDIT